MTIRFILRSGLQHNMRRLILREKVGKEQTCWPCSNDNDFRFSMITPTNHIEIIMTSSITQTTITKSADGVMGKQGTSSIFP